MSFVNRHNKFPVSVSKPDEKLEFHFNRLGAYFDISGSIDLVLIDQQSVGKCFSFLTTDWRSGMNKAGFTVTRTVRAGGKRGSQARG
jgi:hypothetical protein